MPKTPTRILAAVTAVLAAGVAGYALRTPQQSAATLAARNPPAEVKTQVIRKTIHIVRHPHARAGTGPGVHGRVYVAGAAGAKAYSTAVHTGASRSHLTGSTGSTGTGAVGSAPVSTRTSSHGATSSAPAASSGSTPTSRPVTTRTSTHGTTGASSGSSAPTSRPVTTRTSTHGTTGSSGAPVTTRTSKGGEGGDGGNDN
jgi:hypothetical protein